MNRRLARERVLQTLYQLEFQPDERERIIDDQAYDLKAATFDFYHVLIKGIHQNQQAVDAGISQCLKKGWSVGRIASIDRAILRIALYELLYERDTPMKAVINEAVEIAKSFSGEESSRFVNGCLGKWVRENL